MSLSATQSPDAKVASPHAGVSEGYAQWLAWLQGLLCASTLTVYRCHHEQSRLRLTPMAALPVMQASASITKLVRRCADTGSTISALSEVSAEQSLVCIPELDQVGEYRRTRHVLVIRRCKESRLDLETQSRLVSWAFESLPRYLSLSRATPAISGFVPWSLGKIQLTNLLSDSLLEDQSVDTLRELTASQSCVLAKLDVRRGVVVRARLLGMSWQMARAGKQKGSEGMLTGIEQAFINGTLPLKTLYQASVEPALPSGSPVSQGRSRCCRLLVPLSVDQQSFVVSLERDVGLPFEQKEREQLASDITIGLTLSLLSGKHRLGLVAAVKRSGRQVISFAESKLSRSVTIAAMAFLVMLVLLLPVEKRVSAPLSIEASERHVLMAPDDGFVQSVSIRAGDTVRKGDVLASFDTSDLQLERQSRASESLQNQQAYAKALASHNRVDITRLKEEGALIQTQLLQLESKLARMVLTATMDGIVLSGSWDDFLGAAVAAGDVLFSLGSTHSPRLVLDVSEFDVKSVRLGQSVGIRLSADPASVLTATVTAIMPLTFAREGVNSVQVHAVLDQEMQLRPGMQGIGKILVGREPRLWQWLSRGGARLVWLGWRTGLLK